MGVRSIIFRFFSSQTEEEQRERCANRNRQPENGLAYYYCNSPTSNISSSESSTNKLFSLLSFICRPIKFILGKLFWIISLLRWPRKSRDQILPVQRPEQAVTYDHSSLMLQNFIFSLHGNDSIRKPPPRSDSVRKPPLTSVPAPAKAASVIIKWPLDDPQPPLPYKTFPVSDNAKPILAPVKTPPLINNDPQPCPSYKDAVVTSPQPKSGGQPEGVTVSVPKFTASFASTTTAEDNKAIQDSFVIPKKVSVKREPKKRPEEVKKEEVLVVVKKPLHQGRWIKHYSSRHRILLVGDGDFSFSACLATAFGCASNMIATSLDSKEFLSKNYKRAESNLSELKKRQCKVLHGIEATKMATHELLGHLNFDRIIFNFPFAGFFKTEPRDAQLKKHRRLVSMFLKNAKEMVSENGEIHISHKTNGFHVEWKLEFVASLHRLRLIEAVKFSVEDYPGYNTKCGFGGDNNFDCNPSKTYKFGVKWVR